MSTDRCISYNKKKKRCRTRLGKNQKYFCCDKHKPPNYDMIKESCYICSKELKIEDMIILKCNHIHHLSCLDEWYQTTDERDGKSLKCPLCRQVIYIIQEKQESQQKFSYYVI